MLSTIETVENLLNESLWSEALYLGEYHIEKNDNYITSEEKTIPNEWLSRYEGNEELLRKRLHIEGIPFEHFIHIVNSKQNYDTHTQMRWFHFLRKTFTFENSVNIEEEMSYLNTKDVPFIEFMIPFFEISKAMILNNSKINTSTIISSTICSQHLIAMIAEAITSMALKTLIFELNKSRLNKELIGETPEERYEFFIHSKFGSKQNILVFLSQYPVLARLICEFTEHCTLNVIQTVERLIEDMDKIKDSIPSDFDFVTSFEALGDSHKGSQTVIKLVHHHF
ncbi:hypothetical protein P4475_03750 [Halalkalibacterium halodurans]|uniref:DUF4135 domain-containing protein n=1 Tax=Halalkalibacterium halodurans TaxID=86665 RepID=UPI002E227C27|nr:hypothetical protein [Halalkalibacterium halodurans]